MKRLPWRVVWLFFVVVICLSGWLRPAIIHEMGSAIASGPDPRLIQLEFEVSALQNQLRQIRSQLSRGSSPTTDGRPVERLDTYPSLPGDLSFDAQFDNLATLVIEINQRVIAIENQLSD